MKAGNAFLLAIGRWIGIPHCNDTDSQDQFDQGAESGVPTVFIPTSADFSFPEARRRTGLDSIIID
jgi:hypothetical protein